MSILHWSLPAYVVVCLCTWRPLPSFIGLCTGLMTITSLWCCVYVCDDHYQVVVPCLTFMSIIMAIITSLECCVYVHDYHYPLLVLCLWLTIIRLRCCVYVHDDHYQVGIMMTMHSQVFGVSFFIKYSWKSNKRIQKCIWTTLQCN